MPWERHRRDTHLVLHQSAAWRNRDCCGNRSRGSLSLLRRRLVQHDSYPRHWRYRKYDRRISATQIHVSGVRRKIEQFRIGHGPLPSKSELSRLHCFLVKRFRSARRRVRRFVNPRFVYQGIVAQGPCLPWVSKGQLARASQADDKLWTKGTASAVPPLSMEASLPLCHPACPGVPWDRSEPVPACRGGSAVPRTFHPRSHEKSDHR